MNASHMGLIARRGATVILAAVMATGTVPITALASPAAASATAAQATTINTADGFYLEAGTTYELPVSYEGTGSFSGAVYGGIVKSMLAQYFGTKARVAANQDGSYTVTVFFGGSYSAAIGDLTYNGQTIKQMDRTYTFTVASIKSPVDLTVHIGGAMSGMFPDGVTYAMTFDTTSLPTEAPKPVIDLTELTAALNAARAVEQGKKTDEAWGALQQAIATAEQALTAAANTEEANAAAATLTAAVDAFQASADKVDPAPEPGPDPAPEPEPEPDPEPDPAPGADAYGMAVGKTYTAQVSYAGTGSYAGMDAVLNQMVGRYFGKTVQLQRLEDGTYNVIFSFAEYSSAIGDMTYNGTTIKQAAERTYVVNVPALSSAIDVGIQVNGAMGGVVVTFAMTVDTASIKEAASGGSTGGSTSGSGTSSSEQPSSQNSAPEQLSQAKEGFQAGHTYRVPIAFKKLGSSEQSMANQYFGSYANVYVQADGSFKVSFTTNMAEWISNLSSSKGTVTQDGSTFSMVLTATQADTVLPLSMYVKPMKSQVSCDLYLYLSRATDLGSGDKGKPSGLPQTGDASVLATVAAAGAGVAVLGVGMALERRRERVNR